MFPQRNSMQISNIVRLSVFFWISILIIILLFDTFGLYFFSSASAVSASAATIKTNNTTLTNISQKRSAISNLYKRSVPNSKSRSKTTNDKLLLFDDEEDDGDGDDDDNYDYEDDRLDRGRNKSFGDESSEDKSNDDDDGDEFDEDFYSIENQQKKKKNGKKWQKSAKAFGTENFAKSTTATQSGKSSKSETNRLSSKRKKQTTTDNNNNNNQLKHNKQNKIDIEKKTVLQERKNARNPTSKLAAKTSNSNLKATKDLHKSNNNNNNYNNNKFKYLNKKKQSLKAPQSTTSTTTTSSTRATATITTAASLNTLLQEFINKSSSSSDISGSICDDVRCEPDEYCFVPEPGVAECRKKRSLALATSATVRSNGAQNRFNSVKFYDRSTLIKLDKDEEDDQNTDEDNDGNETEDDTEDLDEDIIGNDDEDSRHNESGDDNEADNSGLEPNEHWNRSKPNYHHNNHNNNHQQKSKTNKLKSLSKSKATNNNNNSQSQNKKKVNINNSNNKHSRKLTTNNSKNSNQKSQPIPNSKPVATNTQINRKQTKLFQSKAETKLQHQNLMINDDEDYDEDEDEDDEPLDSADSKDSREKSQHFGKHNDAQMRNEDNVNDGDDEDELEPGDDDDENEGDEESDLDADEEGDNPSNDSIRNNHNYQQTIKATAKLSLKAKKPKPINNSDNNRIVSSSSSLSNYRQTALPAAFQQSFQSPLYNSSKIVQCPSCPFGKGQTVCGSDNATYSSMCRLEFHNCIHRTEVKFVCFGFCPCMKVYEKVQLKSKNLSNSKNLANTLKSQYYNAEISGNKQQTTKLKKTSNSVLPKKIALSDYHQYQIPDKTRAAYSLTTVPSAKIGNPTKDLKSLKAKVPPVPVCTTEQLRSMGLRLLDWFLVVMNEEFKQKKLQELKLKIAKSIANKDKKLSNNEAKPKSLTPESTVHSKLDTIKQKQQQRTLPNCEPQVSFMFYHFDTNQDFRLSIKELYYLEHDENEHCLEPYLVQCDEDNNEFLSAYEWCSCFSLKSQPCLYHAKHMNRRAMLGAYVPQCTDKGQYEKVQCHKSTNYCWCSDKNGNEIAGTRVRGRQPVCDKTYPLNRNNPDKLRLSSSNNKILDSKLSSEKKKKTSASAAVVSSNKSSRTVPLIADSNHINSNHPQQRLPVNSGPNNNDDEEDDDDEDEEDAAFNDNFDDHGSGDHELVHNF